METERHKKRDRQIERKRERKGGKVKNEGDRER